MRIVSVESGSEAEAAGVRAGDELVTIAGTPIRDGLDVAYAVGWVDEDGDVEFGLARDGKSLSAWLPAERPEELGITLEEVAYRTCPNSCTFCFVDQLPDDLRPSLYVKDEDYRLSFAFGNYVTLTNLTEGDYERIGEQRLSPLYVSVHATDERVRRELLGNAKAPSIMEGLRRLEECGIAVHAQIVIVPGVNDGVVFERTLDDLLGLSGVASIAVVPVGLTQHRVGLPSIEPVSDALAAQLIDEIERRQAKLLAERGSRVVFAVDELYLRAGHDLPPHEQYEDFPQLENGVGLLRAFERDLLERLEHNREAITAALERLGGSLRLVIVTGESAAGFLGTLVPEALASAGAIETEIAAAENRLLGRSVTVAGLLSGADVARAMAAAGEADLVLIPGEALNADGLTLDDMTVDEIARASGRRGRVVATHDIIGALMEHLEKTDGRRVD